MKKIYNISIWFYLIALNLSALFKPKAKLWVEGRKNIFKKIQKEILGSNSIVWFHCASLGEFEQGRPIIEAYKFKHPSHKILLTFFSPSGLEIRKKNPLANWVFYLPIDTASNAKEFIDIVRPIKAIFIKYEFWFNYMIELNKKNIPFYSAASIFRDGQIFFKYKWFAKQLQHVDHFLYRMKDPVNYYKK
jgi:3-deoxy-D-manno-octulosonic-acid transferase